MQDIRRAFHQRLRERPFDFYTAFVIFIAGAYALFSPDWPEKTSIPQINVLVNLVSIYMMVASIIVMSALLCNRKTKPAYAIFGEMWGWFAICAASFAVFLMYVARVVSNGSDNLFAAIVLILVWLGMCLASALRSLDIYIIIRNVK